LLHQLQTTPHPEADAGLGLRDDPFHQRVEQPFIEAVQPFRALLYGLCRLAQGLRRFLNVVVLE